MLVTHQRKTVPVNPGLFRAYDIRGVVGEVLDPDVAYTIGRSLGAEALSRGHSNLVVGRDGRLSGPDLTEALIFGLLDAGCEVINIGIVPTPVLYFACLHLKTDCGVMVTGSHNPSQYNGFKLVMEGKTLSGEAIQSLYQRIVDNKLEIASAKSAHHETFTDVVPAYIERIVSDIVLVKPLKVVVDCGNGSAGDVAPRLLKALSCQVIELYCDIDGRFLNHHPDPSNADNLKDLQKAVKEHQADLGIAFDGDGDRLGIVTNIGDIIWPDRQLMLFAIDVLTRKPGCRVIYDVKCSRHLASIVEQHGGHPVMCRTGHSFIKEKMRETQAELGGEMSGHFFFKERWFGFDDGLYAAARLLEIVAKAPRQRTVSDVFQMLPDSVNTPEIQIKIAEARKFTFVEDMIQRADFGDAKIVTIDGLRVEFKEGWGLVRASNTTSCLVLRFEAENKSGLQSIIDLFKKQLQRIEPGIDLSF